MALRLYEVFPFDFSGYAPVWETAALALLILAIVGTVVGIVVEAVWLMRALLRATPHTGVDR